MAHQVRGGAQKVYRADQQNPKFWANGFKPLRLLREIPFEPEPLSAW
jgi:hypothetical protein